jgi:hypothetical protein
MMEHCRRYRLPPQQICAKIPQPKEINMPAITTETVENLGHGVALERILSGPGESNYAVSREGQLLWQAGLGYQCWPDLNAARRTAETYRQRRFGPFAPGLRG